MVDLEMMNGGHGDDVMVIQPLSDNDGLVQEAQEFEKHRMEYIELLRDIRKRHPNIETKQLEEMAQMEVLNRGPKSRAFYRMQATRALTGSGNVIKKSKVENRLNSDQNVPKEEDEDENVQKIYFDPGHYTVMENVGTFYVTVTRSGGSLESTISVDYVTEDGTANEGDDYVATNGTITFYPGEQHKQIPVTIIDDEIFEEDEHFFMRLSNLRIVSDRENSVEPMQVRLVNPSQATIMVLDDDHAGIFHFESKQMTVSESGGFAEVKVVRSSGARGIVRVPYQSIEGTAHGKGKDYDDAEGYLEFKNDQTEAIISVRIIDDNEYEKNESFYVQLGQPYSVKKSGEPTFRAPGDDSGAPRLGEITKIEVVIEESIEFKNTVDKLLKSGQWSLVIGTSSWKEQFIEAITVSAGDEGEMVGTPDGEEDEKLPTCMDYLMHFLTIFWKVMFAFVPPTDYLGGWLCFTVSIMGIGVLTALIGDVASHFGCTVGLSDAVTAISLVAMGTSLPDTFASKVAAINDEYADSSIGNVTGSNAVNVFLGIGVAWSIAAIVHWWRGTTFKVPAGSLGFSVTVFCGFALLAILILLIRRSRGAELGGPTTFKYICSAILFTLWGLYITLASMENYCIIQPGF
jgi:solute carrier family 8 (sodium/calcium exchanger)